MRFLAALALAFGFAAAPLISAVPAAAQPLPTAYCDGVACVPNVAPDAKMGDWCPMRTRYPFGVDRSGNTLICSSSNEWVDAPDLVGVRTERAPCPEDGKGSAQSPDGVPMTCKRGNAWTADYDRIFYKGNVVTP